MNVGKYTKASHISSSGEEREGRDQRSRLESRGLEEDEKEVVSCGSCEGKELVSVGNRRLWLLRRLIHACMPPALTIHAMEPQSKFRNILPLCHGAFATCPKVVHEHIGQVSCV